MSHTTVSLKEIGPVDAHRVGVFLQAHLNARVGVEAWAALIRPPWGGSVGPNHGFQLIDATGQIVGVYVAVYSAGDEVRPAVCNLAAFCVLEAYRPDSVRLMRAILRQNGYLFTDLSPSGNVPALNDRLGFHRLDTATRLVLNSPAAVRAAQVTNSSAALEESLTGRDATVYRDHRQAAAARHALVRNGNGYAYLMYRRDRRKRVPLFASPLYVGGDRAVLAGSWRAVGSHLLGQGLVATLAERRILGFTPGGPGRELARPRVKMYKGDPLAGDSVDYLYSELTLVPW